MTEKRVAANRANAEKSTGPTSEDGKTRSAQNSRTHGLLSLVPVLPGVERAEDWEAHRSGIVDALQPEGHLEEILTDRIALQAWRLGRVVRYERDSTANALETVEKDYANSKRYESLGDLLSPFHPDDVRGLLEMHREMRRLLEELPMMPKDRTLSGEEASSIINAVAEAAGVNANDLEYEGFPGDVALEDFAGWTADLVLRAVDTVARAGNISRDEVLREALDAAGREVFSAEQKAREMEAELRRLTLRRILPGTELLEKLTRYESHLERSLYRALHELQRLQAARLGGNVSAPAVLDVDVAVAKQERA